MTLRSFMENWFSIAAGIYLLAMVLHGHHRGFIRLAVSMVALIVSMTIVHAAMPQVTGYLKEHTSIQQSLSENMKKAVGMDVENGQGIPSAQRQIIEELKLPQNVKDLLIENNNNEVYELLGVDRFVDYIGGYLSDMILNSIGFVLLFGLVYALLRLAMSWLDIIARLPILSGMNKIAGAFLGGIEGLLFLWLFFLVVTAFSSTDWGYAIILQIEKSSWLSLLYTNNLLNVIFLGIIRGVL